MIIPVIEPLLISGYNGEWVHPHIERLTLDFDEVEEGLLIGEIILLEVEFKSGEIFQTVVKTDKIGMFNMDDEDLIQEYLEMLLIALGEDVWAPGGQQFLFSRFGEQFNSAYPIFTEQYRAKVFPNISLKTDGKDWWWVN